MKAHNAHFDHLMVGLQDCPVNLLPWKAALT